MTERDGRTEVIYDARPNLRGIARLADPFLAIGFRRIAERAGAGLEARLTTMD